MERVGTAGTVDSPAGPGVTPTGFMRSRGLTRETLDKLGVSFAMVFFPELERKARAIIFPYGDGYKARALEAKTFVCSKGVKMTFWNLDQVLAAWPERVFITEGEADACALVEAGIPPGEVLSVPAGAKERPADVPLHERGLDYVKEALKAGLNKVRQFIWCGDNDDPGLSLRSDMAQILGAARFNYVEWPEGCKDANDFLKSDGPDALRDCVENGHLPWPVNGLYRLSELPEPPQLITWSPGFPEWESKVMLAPRTLSVVTGHPGHGKTALFGQIWFNVAKQYDVPICVASFETRPKPHIRRQLRTLISGKLEKDMDGDDRRCADDWIDGHYWFAAHPDRRPSLEWILDLAEVAVVRHECRVVQIDPWNRLEAQRARDERETDYVGRCLRALYGFAADMNCHVQIVVHPSKMDNKRRGKPPELEDIADSKHWDNMVDQGFVVHRPHIRSTEKRTEVLFIHAKSRFEELGYPCELDLNYRLDQRRFVSTDYR